MYSSLKHSFKIDTSFHKEQDHAFLDAIVRYPFLPRHISVRQEIGL